MTVLTPRASAQWRHFTSASAHRDSVAISRAAGCYVWSSSGERYLDALAGLHSVNIGYGPWPEIEDAARRQLATLPYFPNWFGFANEVAEQLAERLVAISPFDSGLAFFGQSGADSVEAAMKLARQYHNFRGDPDRTVFISRTGAYHGVSLGALALNGNAVFREPFEPLPVEVMRAAVPYPYRCGLCTSSGPCDLSCADDVEAAIVRAGGGKVAAVVIEPAQNSGGALVPPEGYPQRLREICDRHGILLILDETVCGFGRVGEWLGSTRYGFRPDIITVAKGLASSYAPISAMVASEAVVEPLFADDARTFLHGSTFGGHPVSSAIALANLDIIEKHDMLARVREKSKSLRARFDELAARHPMIGEVRGDGFFIAIELVKNRDGRIPFSREERVDLVSRILLPGMRKRRVHMKFDDRIELAALFTPPLIADETEFAVMADALEGVLDEAWVEVSAGRLTA